MRVYIRKREASVPLFANGWPTTRPQFRRHENGQILSSGDGNGAPTSGSAAGQSCASAEVPASTAPNSDLGAETGSSDDSPPGDVSRRVSELRALIREAASREITPDDLDAIAVLMDRIRMLLSDEFNPQ
jgi:hypothetical protein